MGMFSFTFGVGVGVVAGVTAANRVKQAMAPATYAKRAGESAARTLNRVSAAVDEGRAARNARVDELGATYLQ